MQMHNSAPHAADAARSVSSFLGVLTMAVVTLTMRLSPWLDYGLIFPGHKGPAHDWDIPSHHHHKSDRERWDAAWGHRRSQAEESMFVTLALLRRAAPTALVLILTRLWLNLGCDTAIQGWQEAITRIGDGVHIWNLVTGDSVTVSVVWCLSILGPEMSSTISVSNKTIQLKDQSK